MNVSLNLTGHVLWINAALRRFSKSSYWTVRKDVAPNVVHGTAFFADFDQRPQHHRRIEYQVQWLSPAIHHSTDWSTHSNTEATSSKKTGDLLMNEITNTCANNDTALQRYRELQEKYRNHYAQAPARFLAAWKEAIRLAGPQFFYCDGIGHYADATDRNKIRPNQEAIERFMAVCSVGEGVFLAAVCSFYNGNWGQELGQRFGYTTLGDIANRLELEQLNVLSALMLYHTGW